MMATSITVDVSEVLAKLDPEKMRHEVEVALGGAADIIRAGVKQYPSRQSTGPQQWKSEKQRRWFFAALREGKIQVPYRRTGKLGQSWTKRIDRGSTWPAAVIGTHMAYAPYVQDADRQTAMHARTPWPTAQGVAEEKSDEVVRFIKKALEKWAKR